MVARCSMEESNTFLYSRSCDSTKLFLLSLTMRDMACGLGWHLALSNAILEIQQLALRFIIPKHSQCRNTRTPLEIYLKMDCQGCTFEYCRIVEYCPWWRSALSVPYCLIFTNIKHKSWNHYVHTLLCLMERTNFLILGICCRWFLPWIRLCFSRKVSGLGVFRSPTPQRISLSTTTAVISTPSYSTMTLRRYTHPLQTTSKCIATTRVQDTAAYHNPEPLNLFPFRCPTSTTSLCLLANKSRLRRLTATSVRSSSTNVTSEWARGSRLCSRSTPTRAFSLPLEQVCTPI